MKYFPAGKCSGSAIFIGQIVPQTTQPIISFYGVILRVEYSLTDPKHCWTEGETCQETENITPRLMRRVMVDLERRVELCTEMREKHLLETIFMSKGI